MTAYERLVDALRDRGSTVKDRGDKATAQCPAHDDSNPSLSISPRRDGKGIVVWCHAGCEVNEVMQSVGLAMSDLFDDPGTRSIYEPRRNYTYPGGRKVHRKPGKDFPQSGNKDDTSLYGSDKITDDATTVYVVEGEKDVEAVQAAGGVAVSPRMGAGQKNLDQYDWDAVRDNDAIIIADKDGPGHEHASQVAEILRPIAKSVRIVEAAVGKDFADHFAAGYGLDDLVELEPEPHVDGAELLDDIKEWFGRFIAVTDPDDLNILSLWTVHTHLVIELYTTPRLQVDSVIFGSGKTTVLDHLQRLCRNPI